MLFAKECQQKRHLLQLPKITCYNLEYPFQERTIREFKIKPDELKLKKRTIRLEKELANSKQHNIKSPVYLWWF